MSDEKHAKITDTANKDSCNIFLVHLVKIKGGGGKQECSLIEINSVLTVVGTLY